MRRRAFTLTEVIVVISIVGVLLVILLPAVQYAREATRRAQCSNHLRQMGLALYQYHADFGCFPTAVAGMTTRNVLHAYSQHSPHSRLLPYLDQHAIYNSINFEFAFDRSVFDGMPINTTAYRRPIEVFLCPSDPSRMGLMAGGTNYRVCMGLETRELPAPNGGMFVGFDWYSARDVADGLSHTAAMSERCRGDGDASRFGRGDYWYSTGIEGPAPDVAVHFCNDAAQSGQPHDSTAGLGWFHASFHSTWYNHVARPNNGADCSTNVGTGNHHFRRGVFSASSYHADGVYVLFADGTVRFVGSHVDLLVWRALGTRQGNETISDSY